MLFAQHQVERQELVALYVAEKARREENQTQQREQQRREQWQRTRQTPNNNATANTMQTYGVIAFVVLFVIFQKYGFIGGQGHGNAEDGGPADEVSAQFMSLNVHVYLTLYCQPLKRWTSH